MADRYWVGGGGNWTNTAKWSTTSGGAGGASVPTSADNAFIDANSGTPGTISSGGGPVCLDLTISVPGWTVTLSNANFSVYGSFILDAGTVWTNTGTITFAATTTGNTVNTNGVSLASQFDFNGAGGGWTLGSNFTSTNAARSKVTIGSLNLNGYVLSVPAIDINNNATAKTLTFGGGNITVTGTGSCLTANGNGALTIADTSRINFTYSGSTAMTVTLGVKTDPWVPLLNLYFTAGTYTLNLFTSATNNNACGGLDFTGFSGTLAGIASITGATLFGNLKFSTGMSVQQANQDFYFDAAASNQTIQITTNGKILNYATIRFASTQTGTTFQLQDNLTTGTTFTGTVYLTGGTLDLNAKTFTTGSTGNFISNGTTTRNITFNGGTLVCSGAAGAFNVSGTGFTTTAGSGTGKISMVSASAKEFKGGDASYNCTVSNDGAGAMTITGSNTFTTLANGVQPTSFLFTAGTTTTVTNFNVSGTAGNLVTIGSVTAASHTLSKASGTVTSNYLSISNSTATGGALWLAGNNSTNGGSNSGWLFLSQPMVYWVGGSGTWNTSSTTNWANSSGGAAGSGIVPTAQISAMFDQAGTYTVTMTGALVCDNITVSAGTVSFATGTTPTLGVSGSMSLIAGTVWTSTGAITFNSTAAETITTNGTSFSCNIIFNGVGGSWQLQDNLTVGSTRTTTLTNGTLDINGKTLTTGLFSGTGSTTRVLAFGATGSITTTGTGTVWTTATVTGLTVTGTPVVTVNNNTATAATVASGALSEANSISFNFISGTYTLTFLATAGYTARDVDFTGFAGTLGATAATTIYGNLTIAAGMTLTASNSIMTFGATSGTKTVTTNGKTLNFPITLNGVGGTWQLQDNMTTNSLRTITLTNGTLDINGKTLTTGFFTSNNSNIRTLAFGNGQINLSGGPVVGATAVILNTATLTNLTVTGTPIFNFTNSQSRGTRQIAAGNFAAGQNPYSINVTAGNDIILLQNNLKNVDFTGFSGTLNKTATGTFGVYGNLTLSPTMTISAGGTTPITMQGTSGIQTFTSNGVLIDCPVTFNGIGGTFQLADALTVGSAQTVTLTNGTLNINGQTLSSGASFLTATGTKNITFNGGTLLCPGSGATAFNNAVPTGFTTTAGSGPGTISMISASAKTFVGGGATYAATLVNSGAGALTVAGSNTFTGLQNTVQPTAFTLTSGTTTTVTNWSINGTPDNPVTLNSTTPGSAATISKASGTVNVSYMVIADSSATGGATWNAAITAVDGGGNTGWIFTPPPALYWVGGSGLWDRTSVANWATSSGGTPGSGLVPLASTPVIFDANSGTGTVTLGGVLACNSLNVSIAGISFAGSAQLTTYGDIALSSGTTWPGSGLLILSSPESNSLTTSGTVLSCDLRLDAVGGYVLQDALNLSSSSTVTLANGSMDINGKGLAAGSLATVSGTKTLTFNGGNITLSGGPNAWLNQQPTGFTMLAGTADGNIRLSGTTAQSFIGGDATYPANLIVLGAGPISISGNNTFDDIKTPGLPTTVLFAANSTTTVTNFTASGVATAYLTMGSTNPGTAANISLASGTVSVSYVNLSDSTATGGALWQALVNNGNRNFGNNTGWVFNSYQPPLPIITGGGISFGGGIR